MPTPRYDDVPDYDANNPEVYEGGLPPRAFLRARPPKRSTLPRVPGEPAAAAIALGRPTGGEAPADGGPATAGSDDEPEFTLAPEDERWIRDALPDAIRKRLGAGERAAAAKGRSHKKGAGKAAALAAAQEQERRRRDAEEAAAALRRAREAEEAAPPTRAGTRGSSRAAEAEAASTPPPPAAPAPVGPSEVLEATDENVDAHARARAARTRLRDAFCLRVERCS